MPRSAFKLRPPVTWTELNVKALLSVVGAATPRPGSGEATFEALASAIFEHDRSQWPPCPVPDADDVLQMRVVTALVLLGASSEDQADGVLKRVPDLAHDGEELRRRQLARWVHDLYPGSASGSSKWIDVPEPSILACAVLAAGLDVFPGWDRALLAGLTSPSLRPSTPTTRPRFTN